MVLIPHHILKKIWVKKDTRFWFSNLTENSEKAAVFLVMHKMNRAKWVEIQQSKIHFQFINPQLEVSTFAIQSLSKFCLCNLRVFIPNNLIIEWIWTYFVTNNKWVFTGEIDTVYKWYDRVGSSNIKHYDVPDCVDLNTE